MCLVAVGLSRTSCIPCPCCTTPVHQLICFMMKAESVLAHGLQSRFCSQQRCTLNNCIPLLSKPMYWINFLLSYYSNWAGRGLLPGLCGQRACAMEQRSTYYRASATTNRVAFPVSIQINPGRAPVWSAMPQKVSDNPNRERSLQVLRWYRVMCPFAFCHRGFQLTDKEKVGLCSGTCLKEEHRVRFVGLVIRQNIRSSTTCSVMSLKQWYGNGNLAEGIAMPGTLCCHCPSRWGILSLLEESYILSYKAVWMVL